MEQGIRKERKKERDGKGFYLNMRTCRPEIALSCMTEHEPLPHTRFVYACVCLEFNGCNVQVRLCVLICRIFAISVYELCLCICLGAGGGVYVVWVCVSLLGALCLQWRVKWSISAFSVVCQCRWRRHTKPVLLNCSLYDYADEKMRTASLTLTHTHTDKHTHRANTTYISFCLISLHTISNLQRADCYSMFKGSCRQLSPCFLLPYRPMPCSSVTVTRIPYVKYVACLVGWCVFTPMLNAKSVIPQP